MITALAFIIAIVILVVFHELGHLWVARWCGVKVLRFSVGFGKTIYSKRFADGEVEWVLSAIPLGGYVKMLDEREGEVLPHELSRAFNRQPVLKRMAIVVAGPLANLLLAIVLYWGLFIYGVPGLKPMLGEIDAGSPAAVAQLQAQQTIVSINGKETPSWQEVRWILLELALQREPAELEIRDNQGGLSRKMLDLSKLAPGDLDGDFIGKLGLRPYQPIVRPVIGEVIESGVAMQAGIKPGDHISRINGQQIVRWDELVEQVRSHPGLPLELEIDRAGTLFAISLKPASVDEGGKQVGKIGAGPKIDSAEFDALFTEVHYPPLRALAEALRKTWETGAVSLQMIAKMVIRQVSLKNLSGPITIADYAGQSAHMGIGAYLSFLALISISLGVLNLLPIPLLDGGHLLYYTAEMIKGSPVSDKLWEAGQNIGIALLVTMMAFALYNDISRLILG
jgi:regulator of sigma E protease